MRLRRGVAILCLLLAAAWLVGAAEPVAPYGRGGAVASSAPRATAAGLEILGDGGNAADAAVAVALALAVVFPEAGNLGGGGFAVVRMGNQVAALDFRETAPAAAHRDMFVDEHGDLIRGRSLIGPLAAGVPGSPKGLHALHQRFGTLPWKRVVAAAIRLADEGFVISQEVAEKLAMKRELLTRFPETAAVWAPEGIPVAAGTHKRLPRLAATLRAYAELGPEAITRGTVASAIEDASRRHGGLLTAQDLEAYRPVWRDPVRFEAFGWQVVSMPLPSSGGLILAHSCALLERLGWASKARFGADRAHLLAESWRRSYADRFVLGDPRTSEADRDELLDPAWLDRRAREIAPLAASRSSEVAPWARQVAAEPADTTHVAVIDGDGNVVSLTTTLNGNFGCGLLVAEAGFLLNNEMDDFAGAPGRSNELFELVQGEANAVRPGHRMLSSMSPTVAWRGDETLVLGSRGGARIPTSTLQVFLNVVVDGDDLQTAVNRPRIHHQWRPDELRVEPDALAPETATELERRGHRIEIRQRLGGVCAARRHADGRMEAAVDPRRAGAAGVVEPSPGSAVIALEVQAAAEHRPDAAAGGSE
jgi:gamma-glutamyltranspeptidase/glutathione hydrolase